MHSCEICGGTHHPPSDPDCSALLEAGKAGANPKDVPIRIYGAYLEARTALRANAPALAVTALRWLLSSLAEDRGVPKERGLSAKLDKLRQDQVVSARLQPLFDRVLSGASTPEQAWALMSIAEHALGRLYLRPVRGS